MDDICVCHSDPFFIDFDVLNFWLQGQTANDAAKQRRSEIQSPAPYHIILEDTKQQYQSFDLLERYLQSPLTLDVQMLCNVSPECKKAIIHRYYDFDKDAVRDILGKKMTTKLRKDMDDVSEKTKIPLRRCRRQFDNLKNILKSYEDQEGSISDVIRRQFLLSGVLARVYVCVIFIFVHRFETSKRKLAYLSFDDFVICADRLCRTWTVGGCDGSSNDDDDFDRNFFQEIRDLRTYASEKETFEQHKSATCSFVEEKGHFHLAKTIEVHFKSLMRSVWNIGCGLSNAKEVRDFFVDVVEKLVEPMKQLHWDKTEVRLFFDATLACWPTNTSSTGTRLSSSYERYINTLKLCLLQLYH